MKQFIFVCIATLLLAACSEKVAEVAPTQAVLDAQNFGDPTEQLFWNFEQKVAGFRNMDKITWTREVPAASNPYPLSRDESDLGSVEFDFQGELWTVDRYIKQQKVAGLIVVKDDTIRYEHYALGNTAESRWVSYSVAKSVTSMLVGAAVHDGYILDINDPVTDYLPLLKNSSYDQSSVRNVLQMASGVEWGENYADPDDDINQVTWDTRGMYEYLRDKPRHSAPGTDFNYNTAETNVVGDLVRSAVGNNLATYLSEKIWKPFGMEFDASWCLVEDGGGEFGGSSLNVTLRDYARLGLFALNGGVLADGSRVLPEGWMRDSTTPSDGYAGYGYLWWLRGNGVYAASGIFGQGIHIDPARNTIVAINSARDDASKSEDWALQGAMINALVDVVNP